ncbi:MAG: serine/threonine protein phosphatase [Clostridia bacterium]|nr:serine/threonine protein phosphatase [Clostridia bacterium]NCC76143.1 serine/threonine protein phosphatase [Clostridia bacterium]
MALFVLSDPHLANGVDKPMAVFGSHWNNHTERIRENWLETVAPEDTVVLPGDISWALTLTEVLPDLKFLHELPGTKILSRGNHDYWWTSLAKLEHLCQTHQLGSLKFMRNTALLIEGSTIICGSRGWILPDDPAFSPDDARIYAREIGRLRLSLQAATAIDCPGCETIAFLHYPPFARDRKPTELTRLLTDFGVTRCYFGHIHAPVPAYQTPDFLLEGVKYTLASADRLSFKPLRL